MFSRRIFLGGIGLSLFLHKLIPSAFAAVEKNKIASFDIDAQQGFTPLCPNELPVAEGDQIVSELNDMAKLAELRVGSKDAHPENALWEAKTPAEVFSNVGTINVDIKWPKHCIAGTQGFSLLPGLPHPIEGYDFFVYKGVEPDAHPYGACYHDLADTKSTGVIEFLKSRNINTILCGGLALDYCVATTARQLKKSGFKVIVNLAACRGVDPKTSQKAIDTMISEKIILCKDAKEIQTYL